MREFTAEHRAKLSAAHKGVPLSPKHRAALSAGQQGKSLSPEHRAAIAAGKTGVPHSPEHRKALSESLKRWHATPEGQEANRRWLAANTWVGSPEHLEHLARLQDSWLRSPEGLARVRNNQLRQGYFARVGAALRERDGDLCQLCLQLIDFSSLPKWPDPLSVSVDHVTPIRAGGTDNMENLWLAHLGCNFRKGARWLGREDGSTDARRVEK